MLAEPSQEMLLDWGFADESDRNKVYFAIHPEEALKGAVDLLSKAGVEHSVHMDRGDAAEAIVACAQKTQSQKIIMGTTRKNALSRFFEGSVVTKVMALTDLPVEVVAKENASKLQRFGIPIGVGLAFLWLAVE